MWRVGLLAAVAALGACAHTDEEVIRTAEGRRGLLIECRKEGDCLRSASRACPHGYKVVNQDDAVESAMVATYTREQGSAFARTSRRKTLVVSCTHGDTPEGSAEAAE